MSLGEKIREIRQMSGMTQEQFAEKFHVTRQTISNWENQRNYPDMYAMKMISTEYGISFDELFKEDEEYIKSVDETKKKMSIFKKVIIAVVSLAAILVISVIVMFAVVYHAYNEPFGERINSEGDIRMLVELPNATPSRAITYTLIKDGDGSNSYEERLKNSKASSRGREGDAPYIVYDEKPSIRLQFQDDSTYNNIIPDNIEMIRGEFINMNSKSKGVVGSEELEIDRVTRELNYNLKDGKIEFTTGEFAFEKDDEGKVWYLIIITVDYSYRGKSYTGVTTLQIRDATARNYY